jgi:hypothetical protein
MSKVLWSMRPLYYLAYDSRHVILSGWLVVKPIQSKPRAFGITNPEAEMWEACRWTKWFVCYHPGIRVPPLSIKHWKCRVSLGRITPHFLIPFWQRHEKHQKCESVNSRKPLWYSPAWRNVIFLSLPIQDGAEKELSQGEGSGMYEGILLVEIWIMLVGLSLLVVAVGAMRW